MVMMIIIIGLIACACDNNVIRVYDGIEKILIRELKGHTSKINDFVNFIPT